MNELKQSFHHYIELDDQINILESKLSELRKDRDNVEKNIVTIIEKNNLQKKDIKIGTSRFQYTTSEKKDGFTQQYVKKALYDYYGFFYDGKLPRDKCNEKADQVFQYLLANRTVKHRSGLKRIKDTPPPTPKTNTAMPRYPTQNTNPNPTPMRPPTGQLSGQLSGQLNRQPIRQQDDLQSIRSIQSIQSIQSTQSISNSRPPSIPSTPSTIRNISIGNTPTPTRPTSALKSGSTNPAGSSGTTSKSVRSIIIPQSALQSSTPTLATSTSSNGKTNIIRPPRANPSSSSSSSNLQFYG